MIMQNNKEKLCEIQQDFLLFFLIIYLQNEIVKFNFFDEIDP